MKPRFATGTGNAPVYLRAINHGKTGAGVLVFAGGSLNDSPVVFESEGDLHDKLKILVARSVPLSVGGQVPGPADELGLLMKSGALQQASYIQISWSRPLHWEVREMVWGSLEVWGAVEWEPVTRAEEFATVNFDPDTLAMNTAELSIQSILIARAVRIAMEAGNSAKQELGGWSKVRQVIYMTGKLSPAVRKRVELELPGLEYWLTTETPHYPACEGFIDDQCKVAICFPGR